MTDDRLVLYTQITLGPAHLARIRALDAEPGVVCRGLQLASREETRAFQVAHAASVTTVTEGVYEQLPRRAIVRAALRQLEGASPDVLVIDAAADPVQYRFGRAAQRRGVRVFIRWAATRLDHPRRAWKERLKRFAYRGWDGYLATGRRAAEYLATFGVAGDRVHMCGNPVDAAPIVAAREVAGAAPRESCFLFVGRFLALKNLPALMRAFGRYRADGGSYGLALAGFGEVEREIRALGETLAGVRFLGHLQADALVEEYLRCAALVLPSYSENWGLVVNEAMHAGMPVLLSRHCGCVPELLAEGENGLGFDPLDEGSIVAALHRFEALGAEQRAAMGARSLEIIRDHTPAAWAAVLRRAVLSA